MLACCAHRVYNSDTQHSDDSPGRDLSRRHPAGGVPRDEYVEDIIERLLVELGVDEDARGLLQVVIQHVGAGGIVIRHAGQLVLTWPGSGMSRYVRYRPDT